MSDPVYVLPNMLSKVKFTREASAVSRCHTVPHHGEYPVGLHTFNMLATLRLLWPEAPLALIWAIIEHDVPERLTGDIPSPPKAHGVVDKPALNQLEININKAIFGRDSMSGLNPNEMKWFKALDIVELYLFCKDQLMLGNLNVKAMARRIENFIRNNTHELAKEVVDLFWLAYNSPWDMCPDLGDRT